MKKETLPKIGSNKRVLMFEEDQRNFGTEVAIGNLIWLLGADLMKKSGVKFIKTKYRK